VSCGDRRRADLLAVALREKDCGTRCFRPTLASSTCLGAGSGSLSSSSRGRSLILWSTSQVRPAVANLAMTIPHLG
jgi:hypothetical protein